MYANSIEIHPTPYKKKKIPKALREALWISFHRNNFEARCCTPWCPNVVNAYSFQAGHNIPESRGGLTNIGNLVPICARCNLSMGSTYTFDEWCKKSDPRPWYRRWFCC
jgi:5-methylcytosine-specific restriction endonuclease McrA